MAPAPKEVTVPPPVDRLTSLPTSLRYHLLTLLPYRSAVVTGAISRQWRNLWRRRRPSPSALHLVPSLHDTPDSFARHVDLLILHLLLRRRPDPSAPLHDSLLLSAPHASHSDLRRWLHYAGAASVADLSIDLAKSPTPLYLKFSPFNPVDIDADDDDYDVEFHLLHGLYLDHGEGIENPHLVRLALSNLALMLPPPPTLKQFTAIESISLVAVSLLDSALTRLVASCPLLRTLEIRRCRTLVRILVWPNGAQLASVVIADCRSLISFAIRTASVKKLHFRGNFSTAYWLENPAGLEDLCITCGLSERGLPKAYSAANLGDLPLVRVLTLCSYSLQNIVIAGAKVIGIFRNYDCLNELQLVMVTLLHSNLMDIYSFFEKCCFHNLEKLFIELPTYAMLDPYTVNFMHVPEEQCLSICFTNLKMIKMKNFKGHLYEMNLVKFFLEKAINLESLILVMPDDCLGDEFLGKVEYRSCEMPYLHMQFTQMQKFSPKAEIIIINNDASIRVIHAL